MDNLIQRTTDFAMTITGEYIRRQLADLRTQAKAEQSISVIDATCGNGHDTLALARYLWEDCSSSESLPASESQTAIPSKRLLAMDVQQSAVVNTRRLLEMNGFSSRLADGENPKQVRNISAPADAAGTIKLVCDSHENISCYTNRADIIVFNLGYLPGSSRELVTKAESTLSAVTDALSVLRRGGLICITMYSGHETGAKEKAELLAFAEKLDSSEYHVSYINMLNQKNCPPEILLITRKCPSRDKSSKGRG